MSKLYEDTLIFKARLQAFVVQMTECSTVAASFVASQERIKHGNPFTDAKYIKECFIKVAEHLFANFKTKNTIIKKIWDTAFSF